LPLEGSSWFFFLQLPCVLSFSFNGEGRNYHSTSYHVFLCEVESWKPIGVQTGSYFQQGLVILLQIVPALQGNKNSLTGPLSLVAQDQWPVLSLPGHREVEPTKMGRILGDHHMVLFREVDVASSPRLITNRSRHQSNDLSPTSSPPVCSQSQLIAWFHYWASLSYHFFFTNSACVHFNIA
jgi:hypothetical protein